MNSEPQYPAAQAVPGMTIRATIIRRDGRREELGTIYGGNVFQKVGSFIRIKLANLKHGYRSN